MGWEDLSDYTRVRVVDYYSTSMFGHRYRIRLLSIQVPIRVSQHLRITLQRVKALEKKTRGPWAKTPVTLNPTLWGPMTSKP